MVIGIAVGIWFTARMAKRIDIQPEFIYTLAIWVVVFGVIGARLIHVLDNLDVYSDNPAKAFAFWKGGLAWYGGLIGGILAAIVYARKKVPYARLLDCGAAGIMIGLAIGRIGCTINGDIAGTPTSLPWGITYTHPDSYPVGWGLLEKLHPVAVYEMFLCLIIFALLIWLSKRVKLDGQLMLIMLATYSFGRFLLSWLRAEDVEVSVAGPLHQAHIISLVLFIGAVGLLVYQRISQSKTQSVEKLSEEATEVMKQEQDQEG